MRIFREFVRRLEEMRKKIGWAKFIIMSIIVWVLALIMSSMIFSFIRIEPIWLGKAISIVFTLLFGVIITYRHAYKLIMRSERRSKVNEYPKEKGKLQKTASS